MWYPEALATHDEVFQDRELFLRTLQSFLQQLNIKLKIPKVNGVEVDMHLLYREVTSLGGVDLVVNRKQWVVVCEPFNFPPSFTNKSFVIKKLYTHALQYYEDVYFHRRKGPISSLMNMNSGGVCGSDGMSSEARAKRKAEYQSESGLVGPVTVVPMPGRSSSSGSLSAPSNLEAGTHFSGVIDCHFEQGYMITINLPNQKLRGVLYKQAPMNMAPLGALNRAREDTAISQELDSGLDLGKRVRMEMQQPRPARSPFMFFQIGVNKEQLLQLHPVPNTSHPKELLPKLMMDLWHQMTPEQRQPFISMAEKDRERYDKEWMEMCRTLEAAAASAPPEEVPGDFKPFNFDNELLSPSPASTSNAASLQPPHSALARARPPRQMRPGLHLKQRTTSLPLIATASHMGMQHFSPPHPQFGSPVTPNHPHQQHQLQQHQERHTPQQHQHQAQHQAQQQQHHPHHHQHPQHPQHLHQHQPMAPPQPTHMQAPPSRLQSTPGYHLLPPDMDPEDLEHLCFYPEEAQDFQLDHPMHEDHAHLLSSMPGMAGACQEDPLEPAMPCHLHGSSLDNHEDAFEVTMEALHDHAAAAAPGADIDLFGCSTTIKVNNPMPPKVGSHEPMHMSLPPMTSAGARPANGNGQPDGSRPQHPHIHTLPGHDIASRAGSPSDSTSLGFHKEQS